MPDTITPTFEALDHLLREAFPPDGPGAAAIVTRAGETLLRAGYGLANLEWQIPAAPETVFRIGSLTKQFTAALILRLVEQGRLALSDRLEQFLPGYPTHGHVITVEHLLTHTSGIKSYTGMEKWLADWGRDFTLEALIDYFKFQPMDFAPGQQWMYNNSGYILLGAIIEKAAGMPYADFLRQEITAPLGLDSTRLELPGMLIARRATGYSKGAAGYQNAAYVSMTQPHAAGGMVSTVDDLAAWESALQAGRVISPRSLARARTAGVLPGGESTCYGYGWGVHAYQGRPVIAHGGGIPGFVCFALAVPAARVYAALLTNCDEPAFSPELFAFQAALQALGLPYQAPQALALGEEDLRRFAGKYQAADGPSFELSLAEGRLWLAWPGLPAKREMTPTAPDTLVDLQNPLIRNIFKEEQKGRFTRIESRNPYDEPGLKAARVEDES